MFNVKEKAIKLRENGNSFRDIAKKLNKSIGTIHGWTKNVELSEKNKKRIKARGKKRSKEKLEDWKKKLHKKRIVEENYNPKGVGEKSEAMIISQLLGKGFVVLKPFGDNQRYDLVVDEGGKFIKIQCKTSRYKNGSLEFRTYSKNWNSGKNKNYFDEVDVFAVYLRENKKVYVFKVKNCPYFECRARIEQKFKQKDSRNALEHELKEGKSLLEYG